MLNYRKKNIYILKIWKNYSDWTHRYACSSIQLSFHVRKVYQSTDRFTLNPNSKNCFAKINGLHKHASNRGRHMRLKNAKGYRLDWLSLGQGFNLLLLTKPNTFLNG